LTVIEDERGTIKGVNLYVPVQELPKESQIQKLRETPDTVQNSQQTGREESLSQALRELCEAANFVYDRHADEDFSDWVRLESAIKTAEAVLKDGGKDA
jgi:hypothetical protein